MRLQCFHRVSRFIECHACWHYHSYLAVFAATFRNCFASCFWCRRRTIDCFMVSSVRNFLAIMRSMDPTTPPSSCHTLVHLPIWALLAALVNANLRVHHKTPPSDVRQMPQIANARSIIQRGASPTRLSTNGRKFHVVM